MATSSFFETSRYFSATPERVFRTFTDPDKLAVWFGPDGFHVPRATVKIDARDGGSWQLTMVSDDDPNLTSAVDATLAKVIDNELLIGAEDITGLALDEAGPGPSNDRIVLLTLRVEFRADGDGTELTLRQGPYSADMAAQAEVGWGESFSKLDALLATTA